jgi:hypothetical protein
MRLELAGALADAVLMEGYALYPYRASAAKNRYRWTFGVLAPRAWSEAGGCEPWWLEAKLLVTGAPRTVAAQLRFFQIDRRSTASGGAPPWDEGVVHVIPFDVPAGATEIAIEIPSVRSEAVHVDRCVARDRLALSGRIVVRREVIDAERALQRVTIRVENTTPWHDLHASRHAAIAAALASTHLLVGVDGGELLSAIDPPAWARAVAASCTCTRTYPVLAGPVDARDIMLCAPFILYDHPQLARGSAGDLCDATEIDELLALRTRQLADEPRPAAIGSRVRLKPPAHGRRTGAEDRYAGRVATVMAVRHDADGSTSLAVAIDNDPAAELPDWNGRYHYYRPDEVEPA